MIENKTCLEHVLEKHSDMELLCRWSLRWGWGGWVPGVLWDPELPLSEAVWKAEHPVSTWCYNLDLKPCAPAWLPAGDIFGSSGNFRRLGTVGGQRSQTLVPEAYGNVFSSLALCFWLTVRKSTLLHLCSLPWLCLLLRSNGANSLTLLRLLGISQPHEC